MDTVHYYFNCFNDGITRSAVRQTTTTRSVTVLCASFVLFFQNAAPLLANAAYQEVGGLVVMEAEHYYENTTPKGRMGWQVIDSGGIAATASGAQYVEGVRAKKGYHAYKPRLRYHIVFTNPGRYHLYTRVNTEYEEHGHIKIYREGGRKKHKVKLCDTEGEWVWRGTNHRSHHDDGCEDEDEDEDEDEHHNGCESGHQRIYHNHRPHVDVGHECEESHRFHCESKPQFRRGKHYDSEDDDDEEHEDEYCDNRHRSVITIPEAGEYFITVSLVNGTALLDKLILIQDPHFTPKGEGPAESERADTGLFAAAVTGFTLINADTDTPIGPFTEGMTLNLATLETRNLNVTADVDAEVGSIRFSLDGDTNINTDNTAPYSLAGDNPATGDYAAWSPPVGGHTLEATPYRETGGYGSAGASKSLHFTVIDDASIPTGPQFPASIETIRLEAESFVSNRPRAEHQWQTVTDATDNNVTYMQASPDTGATQYVDYVLTSPMLTYDLAVANPGIYYVWVRARGNGQDHTVHLGLNGERVQSADRLVIPVGVGWVWSRLTLNCATATLTSPAAGVHVLNVWMSEDGFQLDKILLSNDPAFRPGYE